MQGSEYQSHAHPGHVPAPGQQPVYELETTAAAPRACHHNGFPNRDESGTLLKSPSIRSRQTPIPKNTLMNWRCEGPDIAHCSLLILAQDSTLARSWSQGAVKKPWRLPMNRLVTCNLSLVTGDLGSSSRA